MLMLPDDFQPALLPPTEAAETPAWWFIVANGQLLVRAVDEGLELPLAVNWPLPNVLRGAQSAR